MNLFRSLYPDIPHRIFPNSLYYITSRELVATILFNFILYEKQKIFVIQSYRPPDCCYNAKLIQLGPSEFGNTYLMFFRYNHLLYNTSFRGKIGIYWSIDWPVGLKHTNFVFVNNASLKHIINTAEVALNKNMLKYEARKILESIK